MMNKKIDPIIYIYIYYSKLKYTNPQYKVNLDEDESQS